MFVEVGLVLRVQRAHLFRVPLAHGVVVCRQVVQAPVGQLVGVVQLSGDRDGGGQLSVQCQSNQTDSVSQA